VFLKMDGIYINPEGLGDSYRRASGSRYDELRENVIQALKELKDENGESPLQKVIKWEDAKILNLPTDRVGDLIVANRAGYNWVETISAEGEIFTSPTVTGYKQAVMDEDNKGMWTPFVIMGPGVKKNYQIARPIHHIEQYPTIMHLLNKPSPEFVEGKILEEILHK
jgi:predicted AlkP superfamily phosphohydrolase/phosphomutase